MLIILIEKLVDHSDRPSNTKICLQKLRVMSIVTSGRSTTHPTLKDAQSVYALAITIIWPTVRARNLMKIAQILKYCSLYPSSSRM